jgi:hypothetical protein
MNEKLYIYIDESGDTGYTKRSTKYFILTALIVDDIFTLSRIAKNVYKSKLNNRKFNILHAYRESNRIKDKLIKEINNIDVKCIVFILNKREQKIEDPYLYLLEKLAKYFSQSKKVNITLAKKDTRRSYNINISKIFEIYNIKLIFSDPSSDKNLQIADFYSWAVFVKLEYDQSNYFEKLKNVYFLDKTKPSRNVWTA